MNHSIGFRILERKASTSGEATTQARTSVDFLVDDISLLQQLSKASAGHEDFMGCFVRGFPEANLAKKKALLALSPAETEDGRVLVYVCPECGDIGCGAYAVKVRAVDGFVEWSKFAYVNGYEPPSPIDSVGTFMFDQSEYENVIARATCA